jgi:hypothetical protein
MKGLGHNAEWRTAARFGARMGGSMRISLEINRELLVAAEVRAEELGITLDELIGGALQEKLRARASRPHLPVFSGEGLQPGVQLDRGQELLDLMDGYSED